MRNHRRWERLVGIVSLVGASVLVACVGGGGSLSETQDGWEPAPGSLEPGATRRESAPASLEGASRSEEPGAGGAESAPGSQPGGFACAGTYECQVPGEKTGSTVTVTLTSSGAGCTAEDTVFEPNGQVSAQGRVVGTWKLTATGLVLEADGVSVTCTRVSGPGSAGSGADGADSSSSGGSTPPRSTGTATKPTPSDDDDD